MHNIIYVCPAEKKPSGGTRIIYRHSEIINNLDKKFTSEIVHLGKKKLINIYFQYIKFLE
jgi:hypothetical protein